MANHFQAPEPGRFSGPILAAGVGLTALVFLLIPVTQFFRREPPPPEERQPEGLYLPPPPPPPPPEPPPPPPPPPRELEEPPPPPRPTLEQLELALTPGTGGALEPGPAGVFDFEVESGAALVDLFELDELDEVPRLLRAGRVDYPAQLRRSGVEGFVQLVVVIRRDGGVEVTEVVESSHRAFVAPAVRGAESSRFTPPRRFGETVRARYTWTIEFSLDR